MQAETTPGPSLARCRLSTAVRIQWSSGWLTSCLTCAAAFVRVVPPTGFDDLNRALHRVCIGTDGNANNLHPTPFRDGDVNAFKLGNFVQCRHVPLRMQGHRFARVHVKTDAGQPSL